MSTRRPILMVILLFRPQIGGAERQAELLASRLVTQGQSVTVLTGRWTPASAAQEKFMGFQIRRLFTFYGAFGIRGLRRFAHLFFLLNTFFYVLFFAKRFRVIHIHQAHKLATFAALAAKLRGVPCLAKVGSSGKTSDHSELRRGVMGPTYETLLFSCLDRLVCTSELAAEEFKIAGFPASRTLRIPNGVVVPERRSHKSKASAKNVLYVGRCSWEKGVDILLKAFAELLKASKSNLHLDLVGGGPQMDELRVLAKSLGIESQVIFHGMIDDPTIFFREADLFVLPSRSEGMSNALLEALAHGLPCVVTNVGSNAEVCPHGKAGIVVPPESADHFAQGLADVFGKKTLEWGNNERIQWIRDRYSIESVAMKYSELYSKLEHEITSNMSQAQKS